MTDMKYISDESVGSRGLRVLKRNLATPLRTATPEPKATIYVVDDDASAREALDSLIRSAGFKVRTFASAHGVLACAQSEPPSCMVLDIDLPGLNGLELQERFAKAELPIPIIFLTDHADIPKSVRAIKAGAFEFMTKPFVDESLLKAIHNAVVYDRHQQDDNEEEPPTGGVDNLAIEADRPKRDSVCRRAGKRSQFDEIIGKSARLKEVLTGVDKVAPTNSTVLITGETGTGKELLARAIHNCSPRSSRPFVAVNCGAIPQSLIASELFGHEKGAFTGALQRRLGRFEQAQGGTIFLDEIGELPAEMQVALLRVLQEREFERVGGSEMIRADVRVIAATHRDLQADIMAGEFRSDLFYRLNVFPLEIPSLSERKEDIPLLVDFFIDRFSGVTDTAVKRIEPESLKLLQAYSWPGNIRELQNLVERALITCETNLLSIKESWLCCKASAPQIRTEALSDALANQERELIEQALRECRGRVAGPYGAAAKLGMRRTTLDSRILTLKIDKHRYKSPVLQVNQEAQRLYDNAVAA